jgi:hypothetical protein
MAGKAFYIKVDLSKMKAGIERAIDGIDEVAQRVFEENAQVIFEASQDLVPVRTGALKASGEVVTADPNGKYPIYVAISYGGGSVDYAWKVHEDLQANHPHGGQAKFVEIPIEEQLPELKSQLDAAVREFLK